MANNTILESTATFEMQAKRAGLNEQWIEAFGRNHMNKLSVLAHAITTRGTPPTTQQVTDFLDNIRPGIGATLSEVTGVKRLVFEAQTLAIASLRTAIQSPDDSSSRRVAPAERAARLEAQKARLQGLDLTGPLEPSHWLYDQFSSMMELGEIKYMPPNKCMTRQQELMGEKPDKQIKIDESKGSLVFKDAPQEHETDVSSDLALHQAMARRALAMDLVGMASYNTVMKFVTRMFNLMAQPPAPGYAKISHTQLLRADRQAFLRLAETVSPPFTENAAGTLPLDDAFNRLDTDVTVTYHMLPIPVHRTKDDDAKRSSSASTTNKPPKTGNKPQSSGGKTGKGKGKPNKRQPMPQALLNMHHRTPDQKQICFNYNLGKCKDKKCAREHVCCVPGCYQKHPQIEHDK